MNAPPDGEVFSMASAGRPPPPPRATFALQAVVLALLLLVICVFAGVLAQRTSRRWDLTASGEHKLSPSTLALIAGVNEPIEIILAAPMNQVDPGARTRTLEVLERLHAARANIRATTIDTASADGVHAFDEVLARLTSDSRPEAQRQAEVIRSALDDLAALITDVRALAPALQQVSEAIVDGEGQAGELRRYWASQSVAARKLGDEGAAAAATSQRLLDAPLVPLTIPALDDAALAAREALTKASTGLSVLNGSLDAFWRGQGGLDAASGARARDLAHTLSAGVGAIRDRAARTTARLDALPKLPVLGVARALQRDRAALVIASARTSAAATPEKGDKAAARGGADAPRASVIAMDIDQLLPPAMGTAGAGGEAMQTVDTRFRTEELAAGAIASLTATERPLVVLVHGADRRLAPDFAPFRRMADRLETANMELGEWAAGLDDEPPVALATLSDAAPQRPVIWLTLGIEAVSAQGAVRMGRLAAALDRLVNAGANVLISVNPSPLPGVGAPDPMVQCLTPLGLVAESGSVLLEQARTAPGPGSAGSGRVVLTDQNVLDPRSTHAVAASITGVRTRLPWVIPLRAAAAGVGGEDAGESAARITPVITIPAAADLWLEEEWQALRQTPATERGRLAELPGPQGRRARAVPAEGVWAAVAVERASPVGGAGEGAGGTARHAVQRVMVVGSNGWYFDTVTRASSVIDGRAVFDAPGNLQLLESSLWWLCGRDDRLGRSAATLAAPTIPDLSPGRRAALQWTLIGALPALTLLLGVVWRAARG